MTEKKAIAVLATMFVEGCTKAEHLAVATELSILVPGWCEPATLILKAAIAAESSA